MLCIFDVMLCNVMACFVMLFDLMQCYVMHVCMYMMRVYDVCVYVHGFPAGLASLSAIAIRNIVATAT